MKRHLTLIATALLLQCSALSIAQTENPEEIIVSGRLPGPPLWRVSNGDHHLYIFGYYSPIPKDMEWQSDNVESVLGKSQEYLGRPMGGLAISPMMILNPINLVRGYRLVKRLSENRDGKQLEEVIPADLYQRYAALKQRYFAKNNDMENLRPMVVATSLADTIYKELGLVSAKKIDSRLGRIAGKNKELVMTTTSHNVSIEGKYRDIANRIETLMDSIPLETEIACLEWEVARMESSADQLISLANAWAQGNVDDLRALPYFDEAQSPCTTLFVESSEAELVTSLEVQLAQQWLDSAEKALTNNESTFAVLNVSQLFSDDGLLNQLKAKGYSVREP